MKQRQWQIGFWILVSLFVLAGYYCGHNSVYVEWLVSLVRSLAVLVMMRFMLALSWKSRRSPVVLFGIMLLAAGLLSFNHWSFNRKLATETNHSRFSVLEFNSNYANTETAHFVAAASLQKTDVIVLIEPNAAWFDQASQALKDIYPYAFYMAGEEPFTLGLLSRSPLLNPAAERLPESGLAVLSAHVMSKHDDVQLLATHLFPPISQEGFERRNHELAELAVRVGNMQGNVIVAGDFNTTPLSYYFERFVAQSCVYDAGERLRSYGSWPSSTIYNIALRHWGVRPVPDMLASLTELVASIPYFRIAIDHVFTKGNLVPVHRHVLDELGSDHMALRVDFAL